MPVLPLDAHGQQGARYHCPILPRRRLRPSEAKSFGQTHPASSFPSSLPYRPPGGSCGEIKEDQEGKGELPRLLSWQQFYPAPSLDGFQVSFLLSTKPRILNDCFGSQKLEQQLFLVPLCPVQSVLTNKAMWTHRRRSSAQREEGSADQELTR